MLKHLYYKLSPRFGRPRNRYFSRGRKLELRQWAAHTAVASTKNSSPSHNVTQKCKPPRVTLMVFRERAPTGNKECRYTVRCARPRPPDRKTRPEFSPSPVFRCLRDFKKILLRRQVGRRTGKRNEAHVKRGQERKSALCEWSYRSRDLCAVVLVTIFFCRLSLSLSIQVLLGGFTVCLAIHLGLYFGELKGVFYMEFLVCVCADKSV